MNNELQHYGILGMKWGVRRYQNYDGSYTKKGLERYNKSKDKYDDTKEQYKKSKQNYRYGSGTRKDIRVAKNEYKLAKNTLKKNYRQLKNDKLADQGKQLYDQGKRITINNTKAHMAMVGTSIAAAGASHLAFKGKSISTKYGDIPLDIIAPAVISVGKIAVEGAITGKTHIENRKLRYYYGHKYGNKNNIIILEKKH